MSDTIQIRFVEDCHGHKKGEVMTVDPTNEGHCFRMVARKHAEIVGKEQPKKKAASKPPTESSSAASGDASVTAAPQ